MTAGRPMAARLPAAASIAAAVLAQLAAPAASQEAVRSTPLEVGSVDPDRLAAAWRARDAIGEPMLGADGARIGRVDDLVFTADGAVNAVLVERDEGLGRDYAAVPWGEIDGPDGATGRLVAPTTSDAVVFEGRPLEAAPAAHGPNAFLASELLDDVVSAADGVDFGTVVDLALSRDGRLEAALVQRSAALGGGLYAFRFAGVEQGLHPGVERHEIPIASAEAGEAAQQVGP
ncbi:PRC-barrel domain-containing protein [Salinarimonas sp.]|uniref:PRC-barrel domain-containing protein n=1 Tax=Salinarimonas sp. TaxID=2766526 RepID=UPI0032D8BAF5